MEGIVCNSGHTPYLVGCIQGLNQVPERCLGTLDQGYIRVMVRVRVTIRAGVRVSAAGKVMVIIILES